MVYSGHTPYIDAAEIYQVIPEKKQNKNLTINVMPNLHLLKNRILGLLAKKKNQYLKNYEDTVFLLLTIFYIDMYHTNYILQLLFF